MSVDIAVVNTEQKKIEQKNVENEVPENKIKNKIKAKYCHGC